MGHRAAPFAARRVPGEDGRPTRRIEGVGDTLPEQQHQFIGNRGAAEARRPGIVQQYEIAALEAAGEILRNDPPVEQEGGSLVARQGDELLALQGGAAFLGLEPAREHGQAHRDQHGNGDHQPDAAREATAQD